MRILFISLAVLSLASCGLKTTTPTLTDSTGSLVETTGSTVEKVAPTEITDGTYVTLNYTLRDGSVDGPILETTVYSVAQANSIEGDEVKFQPFSVMMGAQQLIPGFENALIGMKKGEKKVIEVPPELGYGTGPVLSTVPKFQIAPVFTITQDKAVFGDTLTETVERSNLPEDMQTATIGQVFTGANNATARVTAVDDTNITLEIENTNNPFYGKKITVGATAESDTQDANFKVISIEGTGVTLEVINKNSPFYNKKFAAGESIDSPSGKVQIMEVQDEDVIVAQYHPMVGKTLFFDVEILELK